MDSLTAICNDAKTWGADLFVSVHFNAGGGDGYEALVYNENRVALGRVFEKYVLAAGQNSRGVKLRPGLYVLKATAMPAIINEGAFVDNRKDIQDWNKGKIRWTHIGDGPLMDELREKAQAIMSKNPLVEIVFKGFVPNKEVELYYASNPVDIFINLSVLALIIIIIKNRNKV